MLDDVVFRAKPKRGVTRKRTSNGSTRFAAAPATRFASCATRHCPACGFRRSSISRKKSLGPVPLVLHLNGHERVGKSVEYKQLLGINLAKRGILVLDLEWLGMGQLATPGFSHYRLNQLDLCGASGLAPFYLAMSRALDLGLALEHADPQRGRRDGVVGGRLADDSHFVARLARDAGQSGGRYGGFRSNILSDDMEIRAGADRHGNRGRLHHLTALRAGRPTLLTYNAADDCCFKSGHTLEPLLAAARPAFAIVGAEGKLRAHVNHVPGTHNFEQENREQFYAMLADFLLSGQRHVSAQRDTLARRRQNPPMICSFHCRRIMSTFTGWPWACWPLCPRCEVAHGSRRGRTVAA